MKKAKPIAFSTPMVRAIRRVRDPKTQTRRVMTPQPNHSYDDYNGGWDCWTTGHCHLCDPQPRYNVGDILWVREEHYVYGCWMQVGTTKTGRPKYRFVGDYKRTVYYYDTLPPALKVCKGRNEVGYFKRPGRFMPYRLARTFITVTAVKAERLVEITEEDAIKEGCRRGDQYAGPINTPALTARQSFMWLWNRLNSERGHGWAANEWVFVYTFEKCDKPEEDAS